MKTTGSIFLITVLLLALAAATGAQPMEKRHQLEVRFGMWNQTTDDRALVEGIPGALYRRLVSGDRCKHHCKHPAGLERDRLYYPGDVWYEILFSPVIIRVLD